MRIAFIVGSLRKESINRQIANGMIKLLPAEHQGVIVEIGSLPLYNMDLEASRPAPVQKFMSEVSASDAVVFVTPEHNRSIPAALKNALDWGSRPAAESVWRKKVALVTGTSPGGISASHAQTHLKHILSNFLQTHVVPGEAFLQFKEGLITSSGEVGSASSAFVSGHLQSLIDTAERLRK